MNKQKQNETQSHRQCENAHNSAKSSYILIFIGSFNIREYFKVLIFVIFAYSIFELDKVIGGHAVECSLVIAWSDSEASDDTLRKKFLAVPGGTGKVLWGTERFQAAYKGSISEFHLQQFHLELQLTEL